MTKQLIGSTIAVCFLFAAIPLVASAATVFYDDFSDGSVTNDNPLASDGTPVTWEAQDGPTTLTVENQSLIVDTSDGFNRARAPGFEMFDISARTQLRLLEGSQIGLFPTRSDDTQSGALIASDGRGGFGKKLVQTDFDPLNEDIILQLDVIDQTAKMWLWRPGEPMPSQPLVSIPTTAQNLGEMRLWVFGEVGPAKGAFRYIHVADSHIPAVPEPDPIGDFDNSGMVGNGDLTLLLDGWGGAPGAGWVNDVPASVGNDSLTILLDNWGNDYTPAIGAAGVPEPSCLAIALLATMSGLALRRRS